MRVRIVVEERDSRVTTPTSAMDAENERGVVQAAERQVTGGRVVLRRHDVKEMHHESRIKDKNERMEGLEVETDAGVMRGQF